MTSLYSNHHVCEVASETVFSARHRSVLRPVCAIAAILAITFSVTCRAQSAGEHLPRQQLLAGAVAEAPVANAAFAPGTDAEQAEPLHATIHIRQTRMTLNRSLEQPICDGRPVTQGGSCRGGG